VSTTCEAFGHTTLSYRCINIDRLHCSNGLHWKVAYRPRERKQRWALRHFVLSQIYLPTTNLWFIKHARILQTLNHKSTSETLPSF